MTGAVMIRYTGEAVFMMDEVDDYGSTTLRKAAYAIILLIP